MLLRKPPVETIIIEAFKGNPRAITEFTLWLNDIFNILGKLYSLDWDIVNKAGSKLSDLETRNHVMLQDVFGADVTNTGIVIEDASHVHHVSDSQANQWEVAAYSAYNRQVDSLMGC